MTMMIPVETVSRRMWNHREALAEYAAQLPWWAWKRRLILRGAIAAYREELTAVNVLTLRRTVNGCISTDLPA